jgi:hypothetical protein
MSKIDKESYNSITKSKFVTLAHRYLKKQQNSDAFFDILNSILQNNNHKSNKLKVKNEMFSSKTTLVKNTLSFSFMFCK